MATSRRALWLGGTGAAVLLVGDSVLPGPIARQHRTCSGSPYSTRPVRCWWPSATYRMARQRPRRKTAVATRPPLSSPPTHRTPCHSPMRSPWLAWSVRSNPREDCRHPQRELQNLLRSPRGASSSRLAPSTTSGASVSPASCATASPWMRTSTLSIYGTPKIRHREPGAGVPISHATIWAGPTVRCCRITP